MILNITLGFMIPWIFGVILYFKDNKTLLIIVPFVAMCAFFGNTILFYLSFYRVAPYDMNTYITTMSVNLGIFPILGCYFIHFIKQNKMHPFIIITLFVFMTIGLEYFGIVLKLITYYNGWNMGWTFLSYIFAYTIVYLYFLKLKSIGVFHK